MSGECVLINEPLNLHVKPGRPTGLLRARVEQFYQYICQDSKRIPPGVHRPCPPARSPGRGATRAAQGRGRRGVVLVQLPPRASAEPAGSVPRPVRLPVCPVVRRAALLPGCLCGPPSPCRRQQPQASRMETAHPFAADQPLLARDRLGPFRAELEEIAAFPDDIVWNASLLWRIVNSPALELQKRSAAVTVVRHEICRATHGRCSRSSIAPSGSSFPTGCGARSRTRPRRTIHAREMSTMPTMFGSTVGRP